MVVENLVRVLFSSCAGSSGLVVVGGLSPSESGLMVMKSSWSKGITNPVGWREACVMEDDGAEDWRYKLLWCCGVVVLWCCGVVVLWCCGVVVLWCWG